MSKQLSKAPLGSNNRKDGTRDLRKTVSTKRVELPRISSYKKDFLDDWQRLHQSGRYDMGLLKEAIVLLIKNDGTLGAEWKDHALKGNWKGYRELHVGGDFLLIYQVVSHSKYEEVIFVRAGTHSELFN
jgi:mRNA interferase YafQ